MRKLAIATGIAASTAISAALLAFGGTSASASPGLEGVPLPVPGVQLPVPNLPIPIPDVPIPGLPAQA